MKSFYSKETGASLSATIDKYINVCIHRTPNKGIRLMHDTVEDYLSIEMLQNEIMRESLRHYNINRECTIASISDVLSKGSGLGSSSAFACGLLKGLSHFVDDPIVDPFQLAETSCMIEIEKCGHRIGKQDQYAAAVGGFNLLQFHGDETVSVESGRIKTSTIHNLNKNLLLVYSGYGRSADKILSSQQKAIENDEEKFKRVRQGRDYAYEGHTLLIREDLNGFGDLLHEAWLNKKSVVKDISGDYFDSMYNCAIESGSRGGKLIGAGGGGFFLFYVEEGKREHVKRNLHKLTMGQCVFYDFQFTWEGSKTILA